MKRVAVCPGIGLMRGCIGLLVLIASFAANAGEEGGTPTLVLANATLIDGTGAAPRPNSTLVVEKGRITSIHQGDAPKPPPGANVLDLSGRYVLPGLIDSHVHLSPFEDHEAVLRALLEQGVTTVRDMGGDARTLAVLARDARIGKIQSPAIYYSAVLFGPSFLRDPRSGNSAPGTEPGTAPWSRVVTPDSDLAQIIAEAKGTGATGLKLYSAIEPQLLHGIVREAHRQGLKVWSHSTIYPSKPSDAVEAGVDVLSHSGGLYPEAHTDVPGNYTDALKEWLPKQDFAAVDPIGPPYDALFASMSQSGTLLEPTVGVLRLRREQSRPGRESHNRHLAEAAKRINVQALSDWACSATRAAHQAGVFIVAGTDSTPRGITPMAVELEALVECGLSGLEAIRAATLGGARAIGIEATHGSVEAGKVADLVIVAADPLEDVASLSAVAAVVKAGRLYEFGE